MNANETIARATGFNFNERLAAEQLTLARGQVETVQVNIGKLCNQTCIHCHVDAGPHKVRENMDRATLDRVLHLIKRSPSITTIDVTGGAPELNPNFRYLVEQCTSLGKKVIDRCNLTVLFEPGQGQTAEFLSRNEVEIVASLPCYSEKNVEEQRGTGVFQKSINAIKVLNELGYGQSDSRLQLNLVYNPLGPFLPPMQATLERQYKDLLGKNFGIQFNRLYTITNMPIKRYLYSLQKTGKYQEYMELLANSFNRSNVDKLMCKTIVSVGWDGKFYDCDFNQMLAMPPGAEMRTIWDLNSFSELDFKPITTGKHCFGCTAGHGSSCSGTLE